MLKTVHGVFRDGRVELLEPAPQIGEGRVLVTFLAEASVMLADRGIGTDQAANLRQRVAAITDDWERPEMSVYDEG